MKVVMRLTAPVVVCAFALYGQLLNAQQKASSSSAPVHLVITDIGLKADAELPRLRQDEVKVKQGKTFLQLTQLIPAQGDNAALQLMILIEDTLDTSVGNNLNDIRDFIKAQPSSALIGIAYMANATVNVVQNFTPDHEAGPKALRLPGGGISTQDSPYLSLISLVKCWQQQNGRREVLMVSDGIDRLRGEKPTAAQLGPSLSSMPIYHSMPTIRIDATAASEISQRYNVIVHSVYSPEVGRVGRSSWDLQVGTVWTLEDCRRNQGRMLLVGNVELGKLQALPRAVPEDA